MFYLLAVLQFAENTVIVFFRDALGKAAGSLNKHLQRSLQQLEIYITITFNFFLRVFNEKYICLMSEPNVEKGLDVRHFMEMLASNRDFIKLEGWQLGK